MYENILWEIEHGYHDSRIGTLLESHRTDIVVAAKERLFVLYSQIPERRQHPLFTRRIGNAY